MTSTADKNSEEGLPSQVQTGKASSRPLLLCLASALLFGLATPLSKDLLPQFGEFGLAALLYCGAALAALPLSFSGGSAKRFWEPKHLAILCGMILLGGILGPVLLLAALARSSAASVSLWLNLEGVATALLGALFFREFIGKKTWIALAMIAFAGLALTLEEPSDQLLPALLATAACLCWGADNSLSSLIDGLTPAQSTLVKGLVAGLFNLAMAYWWSDFSLSLQSTALLKALAIGALSYGLSITLYVQAAQDIGATRSQLIFSSAPFLGLLYAWTFLSEKVEAGQIVAAVLMASGIILMSRSKHGHSHTHEALTHSHSHSHDDGHHNHSHDGLAANTRHVHEHSHESMEHSHEHLPDLHHRHDHP